MLAPPASRGQLSLKPEFIARGDLGRGFASIDYAAYAAETPAVGPCGLYGRIGAAEGGDLGPRRAS
jgi:hypothetical protein